MTMDAKRRAQVVAQLRDLLRRGQFWLLSTEATAVRDAADALEAPKSSMDSLVERVRALEDFARRVAMARVHVGHDGDEESGQHDPDCEGCVVDALKAEANHLLDGPPDPERGRETRAEVERPDVSTGEDGQ